MTRPVTWHGVGVQTAAELQRKHRRLDRKNRNTVDVLQQTRAGARLILHYRNGKAIWLLDPGGEVAAETAARVIAHLDVVAVGDCLFTSALSQTFRFVEERE
jgi:hypothetical protein